MSGGNCQMDIYKIRLIAGIVPHTVSLVLLFTGAGIAFLYKRKYPLNCCLVLAALCLLSAELLSGIYVQEQAMILGHEDGWSQMQIGTYLATFGVARQFLFNASLALFLVAIFSKRYPIPMVAPQTQSSGQSGTLNSPQHGGFWRRFAALVLDSFIVNGIVIFIVGILALSLGPDLFNNASLMTALVIVIVTLIIIFSWIYFAAMESSTRQRTLGKMALGIRVVDLAYNRIGFWKASGRHFGKFVSGAIPLFIGFAMAGFTKRKQALHDLMSGCLVICDEKES